MASSPSALFTVVLFVTLALGAAWKYPDTTKRLLDKYTSIVIAIYLVLAIITAIVFLSTGQTGLIVIGALILTVVFLKVWFNIGGRSEVENHL